MEQLRLGSLKLFEERNATYNYTRYIYKAKRKKKGQKRKRIFIGTEIIFSFDLGIPNGKSLVLEVLQEMEKRGGLE